VPENTGNKTVNSLYVHVPFCARKCAYCAFYSEASSGDLIDRYVRALVREMESLPRDFRPKTIFFGGGTPSLLNLRQWTTILDAMQHLGYCGASEWTVECNPATISLDKARLIRSAGVNRVSMGVQSLNEDLLDRLGRVHSREMVFRSYDILRQAGFDNVNLDLMFGIPGQSLEVWQETLNEAIALGSEHLSTYEVIYEEDTPLYQQLQAGAFQENEDLACAMYEELLSRASQAGFRQYEVANFAKPTASKANNAGTTRRCEHNVNYWRGRPFHGVGPSATSYIGGERTKRVSNTQMYCEMLEAGQPPVESTEKLSDLARAGETAAFGLRMVEGWPFDVFREVTGCDLREGWADDMMELQRRGWGQLSPDGFRLTPQGLRFADAAAQYFLR
jgi:oxygen-independent coproporphyrinogen-3 oxidase